MITSKDLQTGDLLFSSHFSCSISQAIDMVTQTGDDNHFSHVGIVEREDDSIHIYHAAPLKGVFREPLMLFAHPDEKENLITVFRLKEQFQSYLSPAIALAKSLIGEKYNPGFRLTSPGYYCSEFIYRIFSPDKIFDLNPMTFKGTESQEFTSQWIDYFEKIGFPIPEHQPGCNPNGMACSDKLDRIGNLNFNR